MIFLSFDLIIEVRKTENFSFLAPTIYNIWKLEVLGNFTPCLILKKNAFSRPDQSELPREVVL